jgi:tripartite-type tricarboxylate transporter receptor subunit TctC
MLRATPSFLVALLVLACGVGVTRAADYPTRPITLVVAFTPGGASDVLARILGRKLEQILRQPLVIDERTDSSSSMS